MRGAGRRTGSASASSAATCNIQYEVPQPRLFSFNNPFGACPICHGFGNIIELDMDLVVPDAVEVDPAERDRAVEQAALPRAARRAEARGARARVRLDVPWSELTDDEKRFVIEGDGAQLRRRQGLLPLARAQEVQGPRPRVPEPLPRLPDLPGVRRRAAAARGARRPRRRPHDRRRLRADRARGGRASSPSWRCRRRTRRSPTRCCARSASGSGSCATSGSTT